MMSLMRVERAALWLLLVATVWFRTTCAVPTRDEALRELRLPREFSDKELKSAHRRRSLETHPDKAGGSHEQFMRVSEAYQALSSSSSRKDSGSSSGGRKKNSSGGGTRFSNSSSSSSRNNSSGGGTKSSGFESDDKMSEEEPMQWAEDLFFDLFDDLFDEDKMGLKIDKFFRDAKPSIWIELLKGGLKWGLPRIPAFVESDAFTIQVMGVTLTGKEFRKMREARNERLKRKQKEKEQKQDL